MNNKEKVFLTSLIIFIFIFAVYLFNISPSVINQIHDSNGLVITAATYGIPHQFYPLLIMLGFFFSKIPIGQVAFRLNLMSAISAVLFCLFLYLFLLKFIKSKNINEFYLKIISFSIAVLTLAFFEKIWIQAEYFEVHIIYTMAVGFFMISLLSYEKSSSANRLYLLTFSIGFLLAISPVTSPFFLIFFVPYLYFQFKKNFISKKIFFIGAIFLLIPFLSFIPYFYQLTHARINYIETFALGMTPWFWKIYSFQSTFWRLIWSIAGWGRVIFFQTNISEFFKNLNLYFFKPMINNLSLLGIPLICFGFCKSLKIHFKLTITSLLTVITLIITMLSFKLDQMDEKILSVWFFIFWWYGVGIFFTIKIIFDKVGRVKLFHNKQFLLLLILPLLIIITYELNTNRFKTDLRFNKNLKNRIIKQLNRYPDNAILATAWGSPLNYFLIVEKVRPDIQVYVGYANIRSRINQLKEKYGKRLIVEKSWTGENW